MTHFHPGQLVLGVVVALLAGVIAFVFMTLAYKLTPAHRLRTHPSGVANGLAYQFIFTSQTSYGSADFQ